jgi:hypothetical protein
MPADRSSSDSSGGALLQSRALEETPRKDDMGSTTKSSDSPSDDEMALVQASNKFNQLVNDAHGYRPIVAADEYHQGHHLRRSSTARLPTTHMGQSIYGSPANSVPPNVASSVRISFLSKSSIIWQDYSLPYQSLLSLSLYALL